MSELFASGIAGVSAGAAKAPTAPMIVPAAIIPSVVSRIGFILRSPFEHRRLGSPASRFRTAPFDDKSSPKARKYLRHEIVRTIRSVVRHGICWAIRLKDCIVGRKRGSLQNWGIVMIRKIVIAGVALGVIAAFATVSQPVQAGGCVLVSAKARGLGEAAASKRSQAKLMHNINHWAHKNKLAAVHTGHAPTSCSKGKAGALFVCTLQRRFALRTESS